MDGLAIVTGIGIVSFLLFYLSFNLEKEHTFLKILTLITGVFILIFIAQTTIELDKDCAVLSDGSYSCYYSNGTQVSDYGNRNIGTNFFTGLLWYIRILVIYIIVFYSWKMLNYFGFVQKKPKYRVLNSRRKL